MKYAVMSDIHANPTALARAVDDARKNGVDDFVCLGDFVGYGPSPNEAITLSRKVFGDRVVLGNHDVAMLKEMSMDSFSRRAQKSISAQRFMVNEANLNWLASCSQFIKDKNLLFVHGDVCMEGDELKAGFGYVFRPEDVNRVLSTVAALGINIIFVGHTHEPMIWKANGEGVVELLNENRIIASSSERFVVNVGTVGCPRSVHYASYAIVDIKEDGNVDIELRKIPFDYSAYRDSLLDAGVDVPIWLEDMLSTMNADEERASCANSCAEIPTPTTTTNYSPGYAKVMF